MPRKEFGLPLEWIEIKPRTGQNSPSNIKAIAERSGRNLPATHPAAVRIVPAAWLLLMRPGGFGL